MRNKSAFLGLSLSTLLFLLIIGFEIYINGRPKNFDYCNIGDYPYSNWYYEYGDFAWGNVEWSKIFGSAKIYIELLFLIPYFIYFTSKIKGRSNGLYRSVWLKIIMVISSIPLFIVFLSLLEYSQRVVTDYDPNRDPAVKTIINVYVITTIGYYLNMFCWIMVHMVRKIAMGINMRNS